MYEGKKRDNITHRLHTPDKKKDSEKTRQWKREGNVEVEVGCIKVFG